MTRTSRWFGTALRTAALGVLVVLAGACSGDDGAAPAATEPPTTEAPPTTALSGPPIDAVPTGLRSISAGQCFWPPEDDPEADDVAVWVVDCATPHRHEVAEVLRYDGPVARQGRFPGSSVIKDWADEQCFARFESFVGTPWTRSELDLATWYPTAASWDRTDRAVICVVFDPDEEFTTGSFRNSRR